MVVCEQISQPGPGFKDALQAFHGIFTITGYAELSKGKPMSTNKPAKRPEHQRLVVPAAGISTATERETEVRLEFARYLEKRDRVRKANGRLRRSLLHQQLAS